MFENFQSDTLLNIEHYVHEKTNPSGAMKSTGYRPPDLSKSRSLFNLYITCYALLNFIHEMLYSP